MSSNIGAVGNVYTSQADIDKELRSTRNRVSIISALAVAAIAGLATFSELFLMSGCSFPASLIVGLIAGVVCGVATFIFVQVKAYQEQKQAAPILAASHASLNQARQNLANTISQSNQLQQSLADAQQRQKDLFIKRLEERAAKTEEDIARYNEENGASRDLLIEVAKNNFVMTAKLTAKLLPKEDREEILSPYYDDYPELREE